MRLLQGRQAHARLGPEGDTHSALAVRVSAAAVRAVCYGDNAGA